MRNRYSRRRPLKSSIKFRATCSIPSPSSHTKRKSMDNQVCSSLDHLHVPGQRARLRLTQREGDLLFRESRLLNENDLRTEAELSPNSSSSA